VPRAGKEIIAVFPPGKSLANAFRGICLPAVPPSLFRGRTPPPRFLPLPTHPPCARELESIPARALPIRRGVGVLLREKVAWRPPLFTHSPGPPPLESIGPPFSWVQPPRSLRHYSFFARLLLIKWQVLVLMVPLNRLLIRHEHLEAPPLQELASPFIPFLGALQQNRLFRLLFKRFQGTPSGAVV